MHDPPLLARLQHTASALRTRPSPLSASSSSSLLHPSLLETPLVPPGLRHGLLIVPVHRNAHSKPQPAALCVMAKKALKC